MFLKKRKRKQVTLKYCKKEYQKNLKYRYAVCVGENKIPIWMCETIDIAKDGVETHIKSGAVLPVEIIDLAFY